jgi:hypothetical protein
MSARKKKRKRTDNDDSSSGSNDSQSARAASLNPTYSVPFSAGNASLISDMMHWGMHFLTATRTKPTKQLLRNQSVQGMPNLFIVCFVFMDMPLATTMISSYKPLFTTQGKHLQYLHTFTKSSSVSVVSSSSFSLLQPFELPTW